MKPVTSNLTCSWGFPRPIIKSHQKKSGCNPGLGELLKIWGSPIIFLQQLGLATSKLVYSLGLPRPIIKSHPEESGHDLGLGELPNILGFPYNISVTAGASDFKFGSQLGFAKDHHKITQKKKGVTLD